MGAQELDNLNDSELEKIVLEGTNLHVPTSRASAAKRTLDNSRQKKLIESAEKVKIVTKQLENSHSELLQIVKAMTEVISILTFLKNHWFPRKPLWIKVGAFLFLTIGLGIVLNLAADWIAKFVLHW